MKQTAGLFSLLLLLISPMSSCGQSRLSINFYPNLTESSYSFDYSFINGGRIDSFDGQRPSMGAGVAFETSLIHSHFYIQTGVEYLEGGDRGKFEDLTFGDLIDPRRGFVFEPSSIPSTFKHFDRSYRYISMPVLLRYKRGSDKWKWAVGLGASADFFVEYVFSSEWEDKEGTRTARRSGNIEPVVISLRGDARISRSLNDKLDVSIGPAYRQSISKGFKSGSVDFRLRNAGLLIGAGLML